MFCRAILSEQTRRIRHSVGGVGWNCCRSREAHDPQAAQPVPPTVNPARKAMNAVLASAVRAHLRPLGFGGTMPHLRRSTGHCLQLVSFQFSLVGGSFTIEVATCGLDGIRYDSGDHVPAERARALDVPGWRPRLGSPGFPGSGDHWFRFGPEMWDPEASDVKPASVYEAIAAEAIGLILSQGIPYLDEQCKRTQRSSAPPAESPHP